RASQRLPEISRATVYNTLGELVSLGELVEVSTDQRAIRYDPNAHRAHQHLLCGGCGTIRDVHPTGDPLADLPDSERFGYTVSDVELTYHGICPDCARCHRPRTELLRLGRPWVRCRMGPPSPPRRADMEGARAPAGARAPSAVRPLGRCGGQLTGPLQRAAGALKLLPLLNQVYTPPTGWSS